jgi:hypothetical protein
MIKYRVCLYKYPMIQEIEIIKECNRTYKLAKDVYIQKYKRIFDTYDQANHYLMQYLCINMHRLGRMYCYYIKKLNEDWTDYVI